MTNLVKVLILISTVRLIYEIANKIQFKSYSTIIAFFIIFISLLYMSVNKIKYL